MCKDLVSVIIPVYNAEKYIETCIDSVLNQTYGNLEVIVINDGSTDDTLDICERFTDERIYVFSQPSMGVADARNAGIGQARGEWILFVDADDWIGQYLLEELMKSISGNEDLILYHTYKILGKKKKKLYAFPTNAPSSGADAFRTFFSTQYHWGVLWGKLIKKSLVIDNNLCLDNNLLVGEDCDFMFHLVGHCRKVHYCNIFGYYYRMNGGSVSRRYLDEKTQAYLYLCKKMSKGVSKVSDMQFFMDFQKWLVEIVFKIIINGIFHPDNPASYGKKKRELRRLLEEDTFKEAIENVDGRVNGWIRRGFIFALKHRWYFMITLISYIRVYQIKNG